MIIVITPLPVKDAGEQYVSVREEDGEHGGALHQYGDQQAVHVVGSRVLTHQLHQGRVVAVEVSQAPAAQLETSEHEEEAAHQHHVRQPHAGDDPAKVAGGHEGVVSQRPADGHIAVKRHDGEDHQGAAAVQMNLKHGTILRDSNHNKSTLLIQVSLNAQLGNN